MTQACQVSKKEDYTKRLNKIFIERFEFDYDKFENKQEYYDKHFLGSDIRLSPMDLLYLLTDIEEEFQTNIKEEDIAEGKISSFNSVLEILENQEEMK
ncbi:peptide maturation system acyl carrier-related protein [Clostridiaceae bacterium M8S5]|nr:peptide maturation system acyl carrier-related protein [Clostridiaceae bacterium M8S5]